MPHTVTKQPTKRAYKYAKRAHIPTSESKLIWKGPGPDGLRADFLRLLLESPGGDTFLGVLRDFVQLLVDGRAPLELRPWIGGGTLVGIGKRDGQGQAIPLSQDARPIMMDTTWRKLCFKTTFLLDKVRIQERLAPQQFAVGVRSGAEAMIHATRAWLRLNSHRRDYVLLQRDVSNAFNSVHTHMFLDECYRFAHASSKFAEFCYGVPSHLIYHGRCMQSARGQQGCPLMGPLFCLARKRMYEEACANVRGAAECFDPEFADDGFCGGPISLVWAIFEQELALAGKYGLHFDLSKTKLHILAGDDFQGDLRPFTALGINIIKGTNVQMLQVPLIGPTSLYDEWNRTKVGDLDQVLTAIETLPHKHISLHLMKQCLSFPKLAYYARTVPRRHLAPVLEARSGKLRTTLQRLVAQELTDSQWQQATLPTKFGGLGLSVDELRVSGGVVHRSDLAFFCSVRQVSGSIKEILKEIIHAHPDPADTHAFQNLAPFLPNVSQVHGTTCPNHRELVQVAIQKSSDCLIQGSSTSDALRIRACQLPWGDGWLIGTPNMSSDTLLSNVAVLDSLSLRLGLETLTSGGHCPFCHQAMDSLGHHSMTCMAGGARTRMHYTLRDSIYAVAERAGMRPRLEAAGLLPNAEGRRPADILCIATPLLQQNSWRKYPRLALDIALVSPYAASIFRSAASGSGVAAAAYAERKRRDRNTETACQAQNLGFEPIVFETTGGCEMGARGLLKSICQECDRATNSPLGTTKQDLKIRLSIDIQRGLSHILHKCRAAQASTDVAQGAIGRFLQENML